LARRSRPGAFAMALVFSAFEMESKLMVVTSWNYCRTRPRRAVVRPNTWPLEELTFSLRRGFHRDAPWSSRFWKSISRKAGIYLPINYEWETVKGVVRGDEARHRVYFYSWNLPENVRSKWAPEEKPRSNNLLEWRRRVRNRSARRRRSLRT